MQDFLDVSGRVSIVTGGNRGIGYGIARTLSQGGAHVVIANRDAHSGEAAATSLRSERSQVLAIPTDVSDATQVHGLFKHTIDKLGRIDILVNNAGIVIRRPALETVETEWDNIIDVNLKGVWLCSQAAARRMRIQGGGRIINISSLNSILAGGNKAAYGASKAGVTQLTRALAAEWAPYNVTVNAIAPGIIMTERTKLLVGDDPRRLRQIVDRIPMGRVGELADLAGTVLYLSSDAAPYVTGQVIFLDGGRRLW